MTPWNMVCVQFDEMYNRYILFLLYLVAIWFLFSWFINFGIFYCLFYMLNQCIHGPGPSRYFQFDIMQCIHWFFLTVYVSHSILRNGSKHSGVSLKLVQCSKVVFNPQGTVHYELNVSHWHSTTGESIRYHYGMLPKKILHESVG